MWAQATALGYGLVICKNTVFELRTSRAVHPEGGLIVYSTEVLKTLKKQPGLRWQAVSFYKEYDTPSCRGFWTELCGSQKIPSSGPCTSRARDVGQRPLLSGLGTFYTGLLFTPCTVLLFFSKTPPCSSFSRRILLTLSFFFLNPMKSQITLLPWALL